MFKIGFFPQNTGGSIVPDPIGNYDIYLRTTLFAPYKYMAYQITGITVPINLRITDNLNAIAGGDAHVYYAVDPAWPYGNILLDFFGAGPASNYYANFTISPGNIIFTVNPGDWLILGVDGVSTTGGITKIDTSGTIINVSDHNTLIANITSIYQTP